MTFNPNYVPEKVDIVIAYNRQSGWVSVVSKLNNHERRGKQIGIEISLRVMDENDVYSLIGRGRKRKSLDTLTRDSVVLIHGDMDNDLRGVRAAIALSQESDARSMVTYTHEYEKEVVGLLVEKLSDKYNQLLLTPTNQVSFINLSDVLGLVRLDGKIGDYFEELAALRGEGKR